MKDPKTINDDLNDMFGTDIDRSGQAEAIKEMFSPSNIRMKSEVNKDIGEAEYFAGLIVLSKLLKIPELSIYADIDLQTRVSNNRKGRQEGVQLIQQTAPEQKKGLFGGLFR